MAWVTKPAWGGGGSTSDRSRLPKGSEECHICGADSLVEVKLRPCGHEMCLECANRMRNLNIFKADAGLKCPFCREFVDGFTDMQGRPDTISDLVEANRAARKSMIARKTGAERAVSTGVPDPQRLVPPVAPVRQPAPTAEATWTCSHCRHVNQGSRAECARCRCDNPAHVRSGAHKDPLTASEEDIVRAACERSHPGLNKAFLEAGTPWSNGSITGTPESIRRALRSKGHERLMRVVHMLTSGQNCERVSLDPSGNYSMQNVLEAAHQLRVQALQLRELGTPALESFTALPAGSPCTAQKAFSQILRCLVASMHHLANSDRGVFVLIKLLKLGSPLEVVYIAEQAVPHMTEWALTKDGALLVCQLVDKLTMVASESSLANAAKATEVLVHMCAQFCAHNRVLMQCARHQHLGPAVVGVVQGALPHLDAFKMGYQLALNAHYLCQARSGCHTLELLMNLKGADLRCREMIRDLGCYTAKSLQGHFGQLALRADHGAPRMLRALISLLLAEREDEWLRQITEELVAVANELKQDKGSLDLLCFCLALPLWSPPEAQRHWAALADTSVDIPALRQQVQATKMGQQRLPSRLHAQVSEVQPTSPAEGLRRFPHYVREGATHHPRHSMLKRPDQQEPAGAAPAAATAAPPPPPPPKEGPPQPRAPPPGFSAAAAPAAPAAAAASAAPAPAAAAKPGPPGFAAPAPAVVPPASTGGAANGRVVLFPDGTRVPMPQPYSSAAPNRSSSAASGDADKPGTSSQGAAAAAAAAAAVTAAATAAAKQPAAPAREQQQQAGGSSSSGAAAAAAAAAPPAAAVPAKPDGPAPAAPAPAPPPAAALPASAPTPAAAVSVPASLNVSAAPFVQPQPAAPPAALPAAQAAPVPPRPEGAASSSGGGGFGHASLNVSAAPFMQPQAPAAAALQPLLPPAPRPTLHPFAPPFQQGAFQQPQPSAHLAALPPHLQQQPPHLQQQQQAMLAGMGSSSSSSHMPSMPAPTTPLPPQHAATGFAAHQPAMQAPLPPPQVPALLPPTFRLAAAAAGPQLTAPAQLPLGARQQGSGAGGSGGGSGGDVFGGFSTLTEMLSELTASATPQPALARPTYRPTYRPAYRPPAASAPGPAPAPAPALAPAPPVAQVAARVASPAERFPMPPAAPAQRPAALPQRPPAPAPAPAQAPAAGAASNTWDCKICSYHHEGQEANFLCCAMCGSTRV